LSPTLSKNRKSIIVEATIRFKEYIGAILLKLDRSISLGFTSNIVPFLNALGYPVKQSEATILLEIP
jgi:hypothetical protein